MTCLIGLDGEMTGNLGPETHQLIQIGLANAEDRFVSDVGYAPHSYRTQPEALAVCGFTPERIEGAPPPSVVDEEAAKWIQRMFGDQRPMPIGFGVSYFDLPYVKVYLPRTFSMLNRQALDLLTVCQYLTDASRGAGLERDFRAWMGDAKKHAADKLGGANWHDAGFDAEAAYIAYDWMVLQLTVALKRMS